MFKWQILRKIVITRYNILRLKCTKFDFNCGSAPDTTMGELTTLPKIPPAGFLK